MSVIVRLTVGQRYAVPPARIDVLHPKGFSVSIPDASGIQLFAFHGNLNSPMEGLEAGQFSADILKHKGGKWTFTDKKHEIKAGDTLYYWLYVQKDSMGYRRDDQKHVFTGRFKGEGGGICALRIRNESDLTFSPIDFRVFDFGCRKLMAKNILHLIADAEIYGNANGNNGSNNDTTFDENATTNSPHTTTPRHTTPPTGTRHTTTPRTTTRQPPQRPYERPYDNCNPSTPPLTVTSQPTVTDIHHHHHHYLPNFTNCVPLQGFQNGGHGNGNGFSNNGNGNSNSAKDVDLTGVNARLDEAFSEIEHLKNKINHLNDIVTELMKTTTDVGTKLILTGVHVEPGTNLFDLVRRILLNKLLLKDLRNDIYSATRTKDGVVFDVANALDKRRILAKAKEYLADEDYKILDYYVEDGVKDKADGDIPDVEVRLGEDEEEETDDNPRDGDEEEEEN